MVIKSGDKIDIRFGPGGLGPVKNAISNLEEFARLGLRACEIEFTYGVYIHNDSDAEEIRKRAKELGIKLSIHAPYWLNLNSKEKKKILESKQRIIDCCRIGEKLGAYRVVFHAGYFGGMDKEKTYENIKNAVLDILKEIKKNNWKIKIAAETMGKINVFGSIDEISRLVEETGCSFCIDFAHVEARDKKVDYEKIKKLFGKHNEWHCHFSGIEYGEKGEKRHILTGKDKWKELIPNLPKNKEIVIINESPDPASDSAAGLKIYEKLLA
ncbi:endonuclease 4 [uncultured archaeon]|nr:endonuclease 4 [uncultured archaeon]